MSNASGKIARLVRGVALVAAFVYVAFPADAAPTSNVRATKHNLSVSGPGTVKATSESQVCVFCHTPHGATGSNFAPLWNKELGTASTYTGSTYDSSSIENIIKGELAAGPGGTSKLCLSCHDGTLAVGAVNVLNGQQDVTINMAGGTTTMPGGQGATSGFTRNLGTDLTNDHPISFTFNTALAESDGELRTPPFSTTSPDQLIVGNRQARQTGADAPKLPLDASKVQCTTCHDPHITDPDEVAATGVSIKFLRLNRFQKVNPSGSSFNYNNDIICLACHDKGLTGWSESTHANSLDADEQYKASGNPLAWREFPADMAVWEASCLNCHDTHTVTGSRRLLREGTDSTASPKLGGNPAIEETCFQCHSNSTTTVLNTGLAGYGVPDIKTLFTTAGNKHMPIATSDQAATTEKHSIKDADFTEDQATLGAGNNLVNRHAECTDCHNPHRMRKNKIFSGDKGGSQSTHEHANNVAHTNIISGALRGTWGVEPTFATNWLTKPTSYTVKKGDPGGNTSTLRTEAYVTREYQVCLKCHSDYGYDDNNTYPTGDRPGLGSFSGGTTSGTNNLTQYTNQAAELSVRANDAGTGTDQGGGATHRSWHPVHYKTGRTASIRTGGAGNMTSNWYQPWNQDIGNQTMYCSDCHGSPSASNTTSGSSSPTDGVQGPHGSSSNFILRGNWSGSTNTNNSGDLCFKCHSHDLYSTTSSSESGFGGGNYHSVHAERASNKGNQCSMCHIAVPHGWKNKSFLVNQNDIGLEAGFDPPTSDSSKAYNKQPYYMNSLLRIRTFAQESSWSEDGNCGTSGSTGRNWMEPTCGD